jgi:Uma2 family endonuclease
MTSTPVRFTSRDLEVLPQDNKRYEIIEGDLFVSTTPHFYHQDVCGQAYALLLGWSLRTGRGRPFMVAGLVFAEDDDVVPDVLWASTTRLREILGADGHFHGPPELVVEALSPGAENRRRDLEAKLHLYSRRGVDEYWIIDWRPRTIDVYRRQDTTLEPAAHLGIGDTLQSPLLPGFEAPVAAIFAGLTAF